MGTRRGQLHLALSVQGAGYYPGSWRHPEVKARQLHEPDYFYRIAQLAERGKFDLLYLDRTSIAAQLRATGTEPGLLLEPFTLLGALASVTAHIGLGAAISTSVTEPFAAARQLAALDHLSGGRIAWLASATDWQEPHRRYGGPPELSAAERQERRQEFIEVAERLWDSWEDSAVIIDKASGRYIDSEKVHLIHHTGPHFRVRGPLSIPRPPQRYPVRLGLSSDQGNVNSVDAEILFSSRPTIRAAADFYAKLGKQREFSGHSPGNRKVLTTLSPILGRTEEEARQKAAELRGLVDPHAALALLSDLLEVDLAAYPLDGPLPVIPALRAAMEAVEITASTLRELTGSVLELTGTHVFVGTPKQLADWMEAWYQAYGSDGFHLQFPLLESGLTAFVQDVIPELQRRGLFRTAYTAATLREQAGLTSTDNERISKGV
ncbi:NtaA/DmoA family FMN-dependent monooxygenase [Paenibacillus sp. HWE-109]|uniref:NtaA/DmoA family FMN-dependent monooxygenase n=1 Tax=Paenibacillus sp. HWE-109 TaxID=1306526 RepID=UPI001EE08C0B|nr:NtaA/DmoA family FMN-dependent monooxygenase [Paenibacillus sp. HWE-109]UKS26070.1 NtaA/DmoA family FMN-dependent monooxygenase [Paenibacillus sp. HWE-109]